MNVTGMAFGAAHLSRGEIEGKRVLEVGSRNVNGGYRSFIEKWQPASYVGVDMIEGPGVDRICKVESLCEEFGTERFDVVISTEMLEHIEDWRTCISNMKRMCAPGGILLVTTRSKGMPYHGWPNDYWRFEIEDFKFIFSDCEIANLDSDTASPGGFVKVKVPESFKEVDLTDYELYCIVTGKKQISISPEDYNCDRIRAIELKNRCDQFWEKMYRKMSWYSYSVLRRFAGLKVQI